VARVACLVVPLFPLAARLRSEPELKGEPVVVCEGNGGGARVRAASLVARRAGIRAGMTLAQARSVLPALIARGRDPISERSAHEALLETAWALSPCVEEGVEGVTFADLTGMGRLYPDEADLAHHAERVARSLELPLKVGIAGNAPTARIAAEAPPSPRVVPPGEEAAFLAPLPLTSLGLERRVTDVLRRWGVRRVGDVAKLPADRLAARLGAPGVAAHRAAHGLDDRPLVPLHAPPTLSEGMELEWPVAMLEPLLAAVRQSLERAGHRLAEHDLACARLELELGLEPEGTDRRVIRLPCPGRDVRAMLALVRLELESRPPSAPVASFACLLHPSEPRRGQLTLFGPPDIHPERLAAALSSLAARLGPEAVGSPRTVDGHLPERFDSVPFEPPPPPKLVPPSRRGRGLLAVRVLRPPVGVEVIVDEGSARARPVSVASAPGARPRVQGLVRVAAGPWRLEEGWWGEAPQDRDYWDVELSDGGLYRLYRDRGTSEWFADGMYD